jgi:circadian clock protein KaiB
MTATAEMPYQLRLYVSGNGARSARAIVNVRQICEQHLSNRYRLDVVDIARDPALARQEQLIAAPTLIRHAPLPVRRFVGDMSRTETIVAGLDLPLESETE